MFEPFQIRNYLTGSPGHPAYQDQLMEMFLNTRGPVWLLAKRQKGPVMAWRLVLDTWEARGVESPHRSKMHAQYRRKRKGWR